MKTSNALFHGIIIALIIWFALGMTSERKVTEYPNGTDCMINISYRVNFNNDNLGHHITAQYQVHEDCSTSVKVGW